MDSRPTSPPLVVSAKARANFYGLTREYSDEKASLVDLDDISPELVDPVPDARPGNQPDDVYKAAMAGWRFALRSFVMTHLHWESELLASMQERLRTPWLDDYFVYTSSLGVRSCSRSLSWSDLSAADSYVLYHFPTGVLLLWFRRARSRAPVHALHRRLRLVVHERSCVCTPAIFAASHTPECVTSVCVNQS